MLAVFKNVHVAALQSFVYDRGKEIIVAYSAIAFIRLRGFAGVTKSLI